MTLMLLWVSRSFVQEKCNTAARCICALKDYAQQLTPIMYMLLVTLLPKVKQILSLDQQT